MKIQTCSAKIVTVFCALSVSPSHPLFSRKLQRSEQEIYEFLEINLNLAQIVHFNSQFQNRPGLMQNTLSASSQPLTLRKFVAHRHTCIPLLPHRHTFLCRCSHHIGLFSVPLDEDPEHVKLLSI